MKPVFLPSLRYPRAWFCAGLLMVGIIVFFSLIPAQKLPQLGVSDKIEHAVAYLLLGFWFASVIARWDYFYVLLGLIALGGTVEIAQGLMGLGRQADIRDMVANTIGAALGIGIAMTPLGRWAGFLERRLTRGPR
ncbi:MAG: VanZ family protein [Steroidobacteraceae bacterium]